MYALLYTELGVYTRDVSEEKKTADLVFLVCGLVTWLKMGNSSEFKRIINPFSIFM